MDSLPPTTNNDILGSSLPVSQNVENSDAPLSNILNNINLENIDLSNIMQQIATPPPTSSTEVTGASGGDGVPPSIPTINPEVLKNLFNNTNISSMMGQLTSNPDAAAKLVAAGMDSIPPDMLAKARSMAMSGKGQQFLNEMRKKGINPLEMRAKVKEERKRLRGENKPVGESKTILHITSSRKVRSRSVPVATISSTVNLLLGCSDPVELSCSQLATGKLSGHTIKVWYNPKAVGKNRRSTKIIGFPTGSELVIVDHSGNLTEALLIEAESLLA